MSGSTRDLAHPDAAALELTGVLFALSDPARLELVRRLAAAGSLEVAECQPDSGPIPKSTLSHHLKILREAGVVRNVPQGRRRALTLRREDLESRFPGLLDAVL
ncbi:helix-turn-helix transcriptional regulator [Streptomyces sp. NBC_00102]|uniref:ArsR/SmtB family transcription factor n=1 Tax=Streptomyces sp. NBC_00102 TaxID=2975652 RepID=UPI0022502CD3|nr:metalloregulator ArsR/SmtB family transcription factor [Streptomyces sp. NBC_00102]MCX5396085.1 metalloregulator ArsR/SmtB family transcription factor [Streptomyces sp. NBC_00102]